MTLEEFNKRRFGANMYVKYQGAKVYVISVAYEEALFGLVPIKGDYPREEWTWVRCENITLIDE